MDVRSYLLTFASMKTSISGSRRTAPQLHPSGSRPFPDRPARTLSPFFLARKDISRMADSRLIADQLLVGLGGADNIVDVENCMTRLRVGVRELDRVDIAALRAVDGVLAALPGDNCQIVLGPGLVDRVAVELDAAIAAARTVVPRTSSAAALADKGAAIRQENKQRNNTTVKNALRRISNI